MAERLRRTLFTGATGGIGLLLTERSSGDYEVVQQGPPRPAIGAIIGSTLFTVCAPAARAVYFAAGPPRS